MTSQGVAVVVGADGAVGGAEFSQLLADAAGGGDEEMAGTAGGVDDREGEEGGGRIAGVVGEFLVDDRVEGGFDQFLDKGIRGVVGAGGLAGMAGSGGLIGEAREAEGAGREVDGGDQFEERLVDRSEFLGAHVAVVDGGEGAGGAGPAEVELGFEQGAVGEGGGVEVGALRGGEETTEGGQGEAWFAGGKAAENDLDALPEVVVVVAGAAAEGAVAQAAHGVAGGIEVTGLEVLDF